MAEKKENTSGEVTKEKVVVAENTPEKTTSKGEYREANVSYMKGLYPDTEINDDNYDELMDKTVSENLIPIANKYKEGNEKLKALMHSEPKLAGILGDMGKGAKFEQVLPKYVDIANLELKPGDADYTVWEANNKHREENYKSSIARKEEIMNNENESARILSQWFKDQSMDEGAQKEYGDFVTKFLDTAFSGVMTKDFHDAMKRIMNYESDMATTAAAAELKGKNEKIVEEKLKEEESVAGDGLPVLDGGATKLKETPKETGNELERGLRQMGKIKSVIPGNS